METVADRLISMAETEAERALLRRWLTPANQDQGSRAGAWESLNERALPRPRRYCW